jgi:hypothetical protein
MFFELGKNELRRCDGSAAAAIGAPHGAPHSAASTTAAVARRSRRIHSGVLASSGGASTVEMIGGSLPQAATAGGMSMGSTGGGRRSGRKRKQMRSMSIGERRTFQWARTLYFVSLLLTAGGLVALSFSFLPRILEEPHLFALLFSLGSVFTVGAFAIRTGPSRFALSRSTRTERPFTAIYFLALLGTLHGAVAQSYLSTLFFAAAQFAVFMCRLEGLIRLHDGRERHGHRSPGDTACASCGSSQWNTLLRTKNLHDAYSTQFESLNYDEVSSDIEKKRAEDNEGSLSYSAAEAAVGRWVLTAVCGISIGLVAFIMMKLIEELTRWKMMQVRDSFLLSQRFLIKIHSLNISQTGSGPTQGNLNQ